MAHHTSSRPFNSPCGLVSNSPHERLSHSTLRTTSSSLAPALIFFTRLVTVARHWHKPSRAAARGGRLRHRSHIKSVAIKATLSMDSPWSRSISSILRKITSADAMVVYLAFNGPTPSTSELDHETGSRFEG
ncbi:hypothetical protein PG987_015743 [Apiospora arundinis]